MTSKKMQDLIDALAALPNVERVIYLHNRLYVYYPRYYGGRCSMTIPAAKKHLARCQAEPALTELEKRYLDGDR